MSKTNPKVHALQPPKPAKPTEEEIKKQQARFVMQQRGQIAQSALNSLLANPSLDTRDTTPDDLVTYAVACADVYIEKVYGFALTKPEDKDGNGEV